MKQLVAGSNLDKDFQQLTADALAKAKSLGASDAEVSTCVSSGFSTNVRLGEVETIEHHKDNSFGVTVYFGQRSGSASTTDMRSETIAQTVESACQIAKVTQEDEYAGLAEPELLAKSYPDLDLYHPWNLSVEQSIKLATECEQQAMALDKRIQNSEGSSIVTGESCLVYANSRGFQGGYSTSRHSISCILLAANGADMERDGDYTVARDSNELAKIAIVANNAAQRTVRRLDAKQLKTCEVPVIFSAEIARGLMGSFISAISGGQLYRRASFLLDQLGQPIFPEHINIDEKAHLSKALGSSPFDANGVATQDRPLVVDGILQGYVLSCYSARKLGMQTTGNAGGIHNLIVHSGDQDLNSLIKTMDRGLLLTEVMGQGINIITGDYSRGATGFWVENGEIQYPVSGITVAGNLRNMFKDIIAIGNDIDYRGKVHTGSILIEKMMVAGS